MTEQSSNDSVLATLIHLAKRAREIDNTAELRFLLVNETTALIPYRQAVFWSVDKGVEAVSGVTNIESQSAYLQWLKQWFVSEKISSEARTYTADLRALSKSNLDWSDWLPANILSIYLPRANHFSGGRMLLAREEPFLPEEIAVLNEWASVWIHQYQLLLPYSIKQRFGLGKSASKSTRLFKRFLVSIFIVGIGFIPVDLQVLAPADLIPLSPSVVRAPMDGVIDELFVKPNDRVNQGDSLFIFDRIALLSRLDLAKKSLKTTQAEYRQNAQKSLFDAESKSQLTVLQSQIAEKEVEVTYLEELLNQSKVVAPQDGIVIFNDPSEWIGKPVVTGERVMIVADEKKTQIEAWLSPSDMIDFPDNADVTVFLNADPTTPIKGHLVFVSYSPEIRPEGDYAYRARAVIDVDEQTPRVGMKGTAKINGNSVALIYWIMRRPWASFRAWIGM